MRFSRLINYAFLFLLTALFVLEADVDERYRIGVACVGALAVSLLFFILKWLTLDGAVAAAVFGIVSFGVGGWQIATLILLFFITSTLITSRSVVEVMESAVLYFERNRRDARQVWANGFWAAVGIILAVIFDAEVFLIGAAGAIAAATADTWATELGSTRYRATTYLISNLSEVEPKTDGGVSWPGLAAALAGSVLIAGAAALLFYGNWFFAVMAAGFLGCMADSYLGATLQSRELFEADDDTPFYRRIDNNMVNWLSTGIGSVTAILIKLSIL